MTTMNLSELDDLMNWIADMHRQPDVIDNIIDGAITRGKVKKSRRLHYRAVLEDAFEDAAERARKYWSPPTEKMEARMDSTLKPCPFCGGEGRHTAIRDGRQVFCGGCGADGPPAYHGPIDIPPALERAITGWNNRTSVCNAPNKEGENG